MTLPSTVVRQPGASVLQTAPSLLRVAAGAFPQTIVGTDENRRALTVDNEGTVDLFVSEDDGGTKLAGGGGVRLAAGTSRTFLVTCPVRIFCPTGAGDGFYRYSVETDQ